MTQEEINRMAREANGLGYIHDAGDDPHKWEFTVTELQAFTAIVRAAERNKLASWMMAQGYATGHGDTTENLLEELEREIGFDKAELWLKRINEAVLAERDACAKVCDEASDKALSLQSGRQDDLGSIILRHHAVAHQSDAAAIRARGQA